ncbi:hypothetical protein J7399_16230 [Shimia sp. R9_1]|uniref:hypothetical protein n=1 Tax=Shimia sp. R9_1 TaxID=2821111 RepID=UPI001ADBB7AC|nr:hypothetical protein [Shimia sp. R9_1]MBO9408985.1 hypothetical protein [Shimia sp. R9_1]
MNSEAAVLIAFVSGLAPLIFVIWAIVSAVHSLKSIAESLKLISAQSLSEVASRSGHVSHADKVIRDPAYKYVPKP